MRVVDTYLKQEAGLFYLFAGKVRKLGAWHVQFKRQMGQNLFQFRQTVDGRSDYDQALGLIERGNDANVIIGFDQFGEHVYFFRL